MDADPPDSSSSDDDSRPPGPTGPPATPAWLIPVSLVVFAVPISGILIPLMDASFVQGAAVFLLVLSVAASFFFALIDEALHHFSPARLLGNLGDDPTRRERYQRYLQHAALHRLVTHLSRDACRLGVFVSAAALVADNYRLHLWELAVLGVGVYGSLILLNRLVAGFFGSTRAEAILVPLLPFVNAMRIPLWPVVFVVRMGWSGGARMFGRAERSDEDFSAELIHFAEQAEDVGLIDQDDKSLLQRLIDFKDAVVEEVMTPRTEMMSVEVSTPVSEAMRVAHENGYTRLPVFENDRDHVVGVFNTRDLMPMFVEMAAQCEVTAENNANGKENVASTRPGDSGVLHAVADVALPSLREIMREPHFVPEGKDLGDLLEEMTRMKISMAIVLDEYGGTAGLVTIEDIIEEIVGDIVDEYDAGPDEEGRLQQLDTDIWEVDARYPVDDLNERLNLNLPDEEDFETLGGFMFYVFGAIPRQGDTIETHGCRFTIVDGDVRRVTRVRIEKQSATGNTASRERDASNVGATEIVPRR